MQETTIEARVAALERRAMELEAKIEENTRATLATKKNTETIMAVINAVEGGVKVLEWIGKPARALTIIIIAVGTIRGWFVDMALAALKWFK